METRDLFVNIQKINDELRKMMATTPPAEKERSAQKIQDITTTLACTIIDLQKKVGSDGDTIS